MGKVLVMAQVALSLLLVAGAALMLSTFWRLALLDPGFESQSVLLTAVDLRSGHYPPERRRAVFRELLERLRAIPGVRSAGASVITPICGCWAPDEVAVEGYTATSREDVTISFDKVSDGYFETLGTAMVAGRDFDRHDTPGAPPVAIINQTMARKYFGAANPIGRHFRIQKADRMLDPVEIVGVVKDAKSGSLREVIQPMAYVAWGQELTPAPQINFELRAAGRSFTAVIAAAKSAIGQVNPDVSIEFKALSAKVGESLDRERLLAALSGFFGAVALLLAIMGLYGAMSYNVARRRNEDRDTDGAGSGAGSRAANGFGGNRAADRHRSRGRAERNRGDDSIPGELPVWRGAERSPDAVSHRGCACGCRGAGRVLSRSASFTSRPYDDSSGGIKELLKNER